MAAGISIFTLMGSILVNNDQANQNIRQTEERAESLGGKLVKGVGTAAKWGAAIGAAAVAGGTAMFGMATKASDAGDRIDKMSQKIGVSSTAFQELDYVLGQNGADVDILQKGFQTLTGIMDKTADGTNKNKTALDTLGISVMDVNGKMKSQEEVFNESVKALMAMDEGVERSTLASELFGKKVASELVPMLNSGVESYEELTGKAHELGFVMDEESVKAAAAFNDSMDDIKKAMGGAITKIGIELMPMFQKGMDWVLDNMPTIQEVVRTVFEYIGKFVMAAVDIFTKYLLPVFQTILDWTKENWPTIQKIIKGVFDGIKLVWDDVLSPVLNLLWEGLKIIVKWVSDNWPTIQKVFETVFNALKYLWENVTKPVLDFLWELLKNIFNFVKDTFSGVGKIFTDTFDVVGKAVEKVSNFFGGLADKIKGAWDWLTKWNNTPADKKETSVSQNAGYSLARPDGSHAGGLAYVPFDGYIAQLHKGERVLTAEENRKGSTVNHTGTIRIEGISNENQLIAVKEIIMDELRREVRT